MLRYPMFKYAMSIVYMHAIYAIMTKLLLKNSKLWIVVYSLATSLALVASPLVEYVVLFLSFSSSHFVNIVDFDTSWCRLHYCIYTHHR